MLLDDVDYLVKKFVFHLYYKFQCVHLHIMPSWSSYHCIWCMVYMFTYALASYRITGGVASSSSGGANRVRSIRSSGTGGVRGRWARRGSTWVCGPPTQFLRKRQAPEHSKSPTLQKQFLSYSYEFINCALSIGVEWNRCCIYYYPFHIITYESWVDYCLALLRPVAIGDFQSPKMIGGY
jgi:hypothetical protein